MYYLPNNSAIDIEGIVNGMLDETESIQYFLDLKTGDVVSGEVSQPPMDLTRYVRTPKIHNSSRQKWMKEFIREVVDPESKRLAETLRTIFRESDYPGVRAYLEDMKDDSWIAHVDAMVRRLRV